MVEWVREFSVSDIVVSPIPRYVILRTRDKGPRYFSSRRVASRRVVVGDTSNSKDNAVVAPASMVEWVREFSVSGVVVSPIPRYVISRNNSAGMVPVSILRGHAKRRKWRGAVEKKGGAWENSGGKRRATFPSPLAFIKTAALAGRYTCHFSIAITTSASSRHRSRGR